jgi:hypothetical protein
LVERPDKGRGVRKGVAIEVQIDGVSKAVGLSKFVEW